MSRKNNVKLLAAALALVMLLGLTACGGSSGASGTPTAAPAAPAATAAPASEPASGGQTESAPAAAPAEPEKKHFTIGVAEAFANEEAAIRHNYFENYVGPEYNIDFIFSEVLADDAATKAFIENCIDAGVDAIIDFKSQNETMGRLCEENGVVYTVQCVKKTSPVFAEKEFSNFGAYVGPNFEVTGALYKNWLTENASADGSEGFLVATALASRGNAQHTAVTVSALEALQELYGLTYEQDIETLASTPDTLTVANDKGIMITLYPGSSNRDVWLPGVSSLLQTGNYGVYMTADNSYSATNTVINEVERSFNINIKVASIASLGDNLNTTFHTADLMGNPSIDLAVIKSASIMNGTLFVATYNKLTGAGDTACCYKDGSPAQFLFSYISATSVDQYDTMKTWDNTQSQDWIFSYQAINDNLALYHPEITAEDIQAYLDNMNYDSICQLMSE